MLPNPIPVDVTPCLHGVVWPPWRSSPQVAPREIVTPAIWSFHLFGQTELHQPLGTLGTDGSSKLSLKYQRKKQTTEMKKADGAMEKHFPQNNTIILQNAFPLESRATTVQCHSVKVKTGAVRPSSYRMAQHKHYSQLNTLNTTATATKATNTSKVSMAV